MTNSFHIQHYPVFEKGIFEKHPPLFNRFIQRTPDHLKKGYQKARETLHKYEETITWPLLVGPGFCGATHPGAENIFVNTMVSSTDSIYNSDCLYVNPSQKVFAISDAPGRTTSSRKLFVELDRYLKAGSVDNLEAIINELNGKTKMDDGATLSLICFPRNRLDDGLTEALAFVAGDTYLFYGNIFERRMTRIEGNPEFLGTPYIHLESKHIVLAEGDFFVIVTDGILSLRVNNENTGLEEILLDHINSDLDNFALNVIKSCNRSSEERIYDRVITRFGGSDNVSALLVYPGKLIDTDYQESFILGGYILERTK